MLPPIHARNQDSRCSIRHSESRSRLIATGHGILNSQSEGSLQRKTSTSKSRTDSSTGSSDRMKRCTSSSQIIGSRCCSRRSPSSHGSKGSAHYEVPLQAQAGHCEALVLSKLPVGGPDARSMAEIFVSEACRYGYVDMAQGAPELPETDEGTGCVEFFYPKLRSLPGERTCAILSIDAQEEQSALETHILGLGLFLLKSIELPRGKGIAFCIEGSGAIRRLSDLAHCKANGLIAKLTSDSLLKVPASSQLVSQQLSECFPPGTVKTQTTVAIVMPECMEQLHFIRRFAAGLGFTVVGQRFLELTDDECIALEQSRRSTQPGLRMKFRPQTFFNFDESEVEARQLCVLALQRVEAVVCWQQALGPEDPDLARTEFPRSLRSHLFQLPVAQRPKFSGGGVHGSLSAEAAITDLEYFFPDLREINAPSITMENSKKVFMPLICAARSPFDAAPEKLDDSISGETNGARRRSLSHLNSIIST